MSLERQTRPNKAMLCGPCHRFWPISLKVMRSHQNPKSMLLGRDRVGCLTGVELALVLPALSSSSIRLLVTKYIIVPS